MRCGGYLDGGWQSQCSADCLTADEKIWKDSVALSYDPFVCRVLLAFGISAYNVEKMFVPDPGSLIDTGCCKKGDSLLLNSNPRKQNYVHMQSQWFKQQLLPGEGLITLQNAYLVTPAEGLRPGSFQR